MARARSGFRRRREVSRREMLRVTGLQTLGLASLSFVLPRSGRAATPAGPSSVEPLNRFPRMVQRYFVERMRGIEKAAVRRNERLETRAEAESHVEQLRKKIRACFGPFPEKTPLRPQITGAVERDSYKIEKLIFESRPGFLVTANLYLPKGRKFPLPGVVGTCGHSHNGKASEPYQSFAQGLARLGYVVLIYDPIGQGERLQYPDADLQSRIGVGVREHLYCGNQQFLVGEFLGSWRAWDGIRALDYLLTREEVDPRHVGVTGNSGGGTMTTWLCGVEQRWTMAAPSCFVTTFRRNMENELPADTEQCPPGVLAKGLNHEDFLAALAPKPVIILAKEKDYFDVRGSEEAFGRLKKLYSLLGAEENIALFVGPSGHGYTQENREAMYRWFDRATGVSSVRKEPEIVLEKDETLWCAPRGQVATLKSRTVFSYTRETSKALTEKRGKVTGDDLSRVIQRLLKLPPRESSPRYRILRPIHSRRYPKPHFTTYAVETEPGIHALVYRLSGEPHYSRPPRTGKAAVLYVSHHSSDAELREEPLIRELIDSHPDAAFFTCDVRGIGESRPDTCGQNQFLKPYGNDYFYAIHSLMLGHPCAGQRTYDLLCVLDWLKASGHEEVHLAAKGWGTIPATFAALLSSQITHVTLKGALSSYGDIAESEDYDWPLSALLPDALRSFDLPDCYRSLAAKELRLLEPRGAHPTKG